MNATDIANLDNLYRQRVRSMQAVDEMIATLVATLKETGQLDNTYIIFTSDNGYHLGQHRLLAGKGEPYEEDTIVPFIIRGPGIPAGQALQGYLAGNTDVAPTIAELAGVIPPPLWMAGLSSRSGVQTALQRRIGGRATCLSIMAQEIAQVLRLTWSA